MKTMFHIDPAWRDLLAAHQLDDFLPWMSAETGVVVSRSASSEVRRVTLDGEEFYLKRRSEESPLRLLALVCFGRRPMSAPIRELTLVQALAAAGFPVMRPVAWGEARVCGLPRQGFLVVHGLRGRSLADVYEDALSDERCGIMARMGELTGRLHGGGFFQPLRLKDLIQAEDGTWTLIDRECGRPWRKRFSNRYAVASLAHSARRTLRDGHRIGPSAVKAFLDGYLSKSVGRWRGGRLGLMRLIHAKMKRGRNRQAAITASRRRKAAD
jgi:hypothetical protein